ncbi:hypothetical protein RP20_CCG001919 [Aedes albopictus]|nr:hypothetical protein RP20_CCG001919 [Aedes albopictus]
MVKCAVITCRHYEGNKACETKLKFFWFPENESKRLAWLKACGRDPGESQHLKICSEHFSDQDYRLQDVLLKTELLKKRLKPGAIPSLKLPPQSSQEVHENASNQRSGASTVTKADVAVQLRVSTENVAIPTKQGVQDLHMKIQPHLFQEVWDQIKMDETQQSLQECVKVKTEPHGETDMAMSSSAEALSTSDANFDLNLKSVSLENQQNQSEQSMDLEDMIEIGEVKVEAEEINDDKPFKCNICPKAYSSNYSLKMHIKNCHTPKIYGCDLCDMSFRRRCELASHEERHEREKNAGFYSVQAKQKANAANSNDATDEKDIECASEPNSSASELQCAKCLTYWPNQNRLWLHYQAAHREKFKCCLCTETFYYEVRLTKHMLLMHKQKDGSFKPLQCAECNKHFDKPIQFSRHMHLHKAKNHKCAVCNQSFKYKIEMKTHELSHKTDGIIWECEVCKKVFPTRRLKTSHLRIHAPKEHKCRICGKDCKLRINLVAHLKTHEKENVTFSEAGGSSEPSIRDRSSPNVVAHKNTEAKVKPHGEVDSKTETGNQTCKLNLKQESESPPLDLRSCGEITQPVIDIGAVKVESRSDDELDEPHPV